MLWLPYGVINNNNNILREVSYSVYLSQVSSYIMLVQDIALQKLRVPHKSKPYSKVI